MVSLQKIVGKMTAVVMTATAILSVLTPSLALAASSYTTTPSTDGVVGTDRGLTIIQYVLDTTAQTWADGDLLTFTLPANFPTFASIGVDPTNYVVEIDDNANRGDGLGMGMALPAGSTNGTYSVTGRVVTVKFNASAWSPTSGISLRVVILSNLIPQYAGTTSVAIGGTTADGLDTDPSGSTSIVTAAAGASGTTVLAANSVVGTAGNTTLTYTLPVALASGATVEFTAPGNLDVSQVVYVSGGAFSGCAAVGQVVTCTANGVVTSGGGKTIVMSGIKSWHAATGQTVAVTVKDSSANTLATSTGGVVTDATVGNLTSGGVGFQTNI
ncbi:MAG: hypothetical protein NT003_04530, partial [Candidatus Magasanikbacteria bacterium]|nr:hypothetical protein [Candidatus Magasanikbacteria bacterium]